MFFVVQLDSDIFNERIIVPPIWLDKYNTLCLLPPTADITEIERIAKTQTAPKHGWQMHSVSFIQSFDTYFQAKENMRKNRKEPEMVELEDEEEKEYHQKGEREPRKRKRPAFLENYSTETDGEEEGPSILPDNFPVGGDISMPNSFVIKVEPTEDTTPLEPHHQQRRGTTDNSRNLYESSHLQVSQDCSPDVAQTMQSINTKCPCNSSCHKMILQSLATMQRQLEDNSRMLHQIMGQLTGNLGPSLNAVNTLSGAPTTFPVTLPMGELNQLQSLNNYLSDQHNFTATKRNTDSRGTKRGRCLSENCDCSFYEFEKKSGANCYFCCCPAAKHKKIDIAEDKISGSCSGDAEIMNASLKNKKNTDSRGTKRGRCLNGNCDCAFYEFEKKSGTNCYYCECPAAKHKRLGDAVSKSCSSNAEIIKASLENDDLQEGSYVNDPVPSTALLVPTLSSSQLQGLLPKKLPKQVELALKSKSLTPSLRNRIVRVIADKCFEANITSKTVDAVANLAVEKWSPLRDQYGESPSGSLAHQIKRRMSKLRLHSRQDRICDNSSEMEEVNFRSKFKALSLYYKILDISNSESIFPSL